MDRYIPLKSKSYKLADQYYQCLAESLTGPGGRNFEECVRIGRRYRAALRSQLKDLERLANPVFVKRERELIGKYLDLINHDLNLHSRGQIPELVRRRRPKFDT